MGDYIDRAKEAFERWRRFVTRDVWKIGKPGEELPQGFLIKQIRVAILLVSNLGENALMLRASALTYATTLSIVPFLALLFFVVQTFNLADGLYVATEEHLKGFVDKAIDLVPGGEEDKTGDVETDANGDGAPDPDSIGSEPGELDSAQVADGADEEPVAAEDDSGLSDPADGDAAAPLVTDGDKQKKVLELQDKITELFFGGMAKQENESGDNPVKWISNLANDAATDARVISIAGLLLVFTTVFGLMRNIEKSFNAIWGVRRTRSWYRMLSDYVMITLLIPFVGTAALAISAVLQSETVTERLGPLAYGLQGIQAMTVAFVFTFLYYIVPNTRVKLRYALIGGVFSGLSWILLTAGYATFQFGLMKYNAIFGSMAMFPMMLGWVYLSWVILLLGAEVSFAYQNEKTFAMERFADRASFAYREALGLRTMIEISRRFGTERPAFSRETAAKDWNVPSRLLNQTLRNLEDGGFVSACATEPVTYQPSRPLNKVTVEDVLTTFREMGEDPSQFREDEEFKPVLERMANSDEAFRKSTMAEVVAQLPGAPVDEDEDGA